MRNLKTYLFAGHSKRYIIAHYKSTFTYLPTYLLNTITQYNVPGAVIMTVSSNFNDYKNSINELIN